MPSVDGSRSYRSTQSSIEERVRDLLDRMTLVEKVAQTVSVSLGDSAMGPDGRLHLTDEAIRNLRHGAGAFQKVGRNYDPHTSALFCNQLQSYLLENTRLGIPILFHEECLHGHLASGATVFPQALALASTWDVELVEQVFSAIAAEVRARGGHQALSPVLDLARDPRWGRTEETYGEDAFLTARMGVAAVRGLQGRDGTIGPRHVIATPKHFAAYGQVAGGRNFAPAVVSERMLVDEILPPFQAAVQEAGALGIMPSHGEIDGIPCHAHRGLLTDVLRTRWGFQGMVVSDYLDVYRLGFLHRTTSAEAHSAVKALTAGVDMELPFGQCYLHLVEAVRTGQVALEVLDRAVARILRAKFRLGLFDQPLVDPERAVAVTSCPQHRALARRAAEKAVILLKNEGPLLPLDRSAIRRLAVIGPNADPVHLGGYSPRPHLGISPLEGIRQKVGDQVEVLYAEGCAITNRDRTGTMVETELDLKGTDNAALADVALNRRKMAHARQVAEQADVVIACIGGNESTCREAALLFDCRGDRADLDLLGQQDELVRMLLDTGRPVVVILINGRPLTIRDIAASVPAIIEAWYLGQETGAALADVLFGDVNPAGRLPITFPQTVGQLPVYYSQKPAGLAKNYLLMDNTPLFPFGHGLSYTRFEYSGLAVSDPRLRPGGSITVSVTVTNIGPRAGDEVVQLYVSDVQASVTRPVMELKGFARITLAPGQSRRVSFPLRPEDLAFTDEHYRRVTEPGEFQVMVGPSSVDLLRIRLDFVSDGPCVFQQSAFGSRGPAPVLTHLPRRPATANVEKALGAS